MLLVSLQPVYMWYIEIHYSDQVSAIKSSVEKLKNWQ